VCMAARWPAGNSPRPTVKSLAMQHQWIAVTESTQLKAADSDIHMNVGGRPHAFFSFLTEKTLKCYTPLILRLLLKGTRRAHNGMLHDH
jgi:hypothetical protein